MTRREPAERRARESPVMQRKAPVHGPGVGAGRGGAPGVHGGGDRGGM